MLKNYLKIAYRVFLRRKFFTCVSLFAISFTIAVLLVATAFLDHIFGPIPPETKMDRTVGIYGAQLRGEHGRRTGFAGYRLLDRYARDLPGVEKVSIFSVFSSSTSYRNGEAISLYLKFTDAAFWEILDFDFLEGGPITEDDVRGGTQVAVINEATRRKMFDGEPAVGRAIELDGRAFRVVGVVANVPLVRIVPFSDVWVPQSTARAEAYKSELVGGHMALLLARDASQIPAIKEEYRSRVASAELPDSEFDSLLSQAGSFFDFMAGEFMGDWTNETNSTRLLAIIVGAMVLFMLLPAVNLVNLNVSRIMERASEIGVRKAFGASSWTLVGQFLVESVVLSLAGGAIGLVVAWFMLGAVNESGFIPYADFRLNLRVFAYGLAIAVFFGLLSGVYPAWRMSRLDPVHALKGGTR